MGRKKTSYPAHKPSIGLPNALEAALEEARHAKEGALRLQRAIDTLRAGLETIVVAEFDHETQLPVSAQQLRQMACATLDEYSRATGQSWRKHKLTGSSRAGDRSEAEYNSQGHGGSG